ncbi:MAG: haloacid dehalogenase [Dehalococcoidia bacterium]|nr:haloacid dehalogenase [Dehalococcoidia bacterium]
MKAQHNLRGQVAPLLEKVAAQIRFKFKSQDLAREKFLGLSRELIRFSSYAIRAIHRRELVEARDNLSKARGNMAKLKAMLKDYPEAFYNLAYDSQKEYAEACLTLALTTDGKIQSPEDLEVGYAAYLNGMGEAVGEMRRYLLDNLRRGELDPCEDILSTMDDIYGVLVTMDFPDALTGGLRRTTDLVRGILERTRGDLTQALSQKKLEDKILGLVNTGKASGRARSSGRRLGNHM